MESHYSQPKGFVGRNICYAITYHNNYFGSIVGGSSTLHLPGRDEFFGLQKDTKSNMLLGIVNNIFFHIEPPKNGNYPIRNMTSRVMEMFLSQVANDWEFSYGNVVIGFETLVELPRTGEIYKRAGFEHVGITKGYTCKRVSSNIHKRTDAWSGARVWNTTNLRPKHVFVKRWPI